MKVDDLIKKTAPDRQLELNKKKKLLTTISFIFLMAIIVLIVWILIFKNNSITRKYKNKYLSFEYDSTWTLSQDNEKLISLIHKTNSFVDIKLTKLDSNNINSNIELLIDEVIFDIEKQNSGYKLLKQEKCIITENKYDAHKLLYENGENQSLVIIFKNNEHLIMVNYVSNNEYFDILLDSFQAILGSIDLK